MEPILDLPEKPRPKRKQHRRSISVSRTTYDRIRAYCEANNISMSQFVETRVGESLKAFEAVKPPAPVLKTPVGIISGTAKLPVKVPTTAAEARAAIQPPPLHIQKKPVEAPKPVPLPASKIFTF